MREQRPTFAEATRDLLRSRLLDAVHEALREGAWADVTMADVARRAGVSRQTVYNEMGSRNELAQAYVLREVGGFVARVEGAVAAHEDDPRAAVAAAFDVFLRAAADHPLIRAMLTGAEGDELFALVTTEGGPVLETATAALAAVLSGHWPQASDEQARLVAEVTVRLAISHASLPSGPVELTAAQVATVLGPYLDEVVRQ